MRIKGTLSQWNDGKAFGFITPDQKGDHIFAHISAFPKDDLRPKRGEKVSFKIKTDSQGKKQAVKILYLQRQTIDDSSHFLESINRKRSLFWDATILLLILAILGSYFYLKNPDAISNLMGTAPNTKTYEHPKTYRCDGRTYCSQMTSCEEAKFFLRNCPNTKMDGNENGVPCEIQWCTGRF
ncbi:MAG: cold shock domain-containing protein [Saezia sp.]